MRLSISSFKKRKIYRSQNYLHCRLKQLIKVPPRLLKDISSVVGVVPFVSTTKYFTSLTLPSRLPWSRHPMHIQFFEPLNKRGAQSNVF
jgi:hypothetical protein